MTAETNDGWDRRRSIALDRIWALDDVDRQEVLAYLCGYATEDVEHALHVIFGAANHTGSTR